MTGRDWLMLGLSVIGLAKIAWGLWRSARMIDREIRNAHASRWGRG